MSGVLGCLMYVGYIICIIASGKFAWDLFDPNIFWGYVKFLFLWGIIGSIASFLWQLICAILASILDKDD